MPSESGLTNQDSDYAQHIQEVLNELRQLQQPPRLVTSPDDLEALEREIRHRPDRLGSLLVGDHRQQALDSVALQAEQERLVRHWPKPLKNDGKVKVLVRTAQGHTVPVWVTYYRRKAQRRAGKRDAGVYAGLVVLGIYDRCPPGVGRRGQSVSGDVRLSTRGSRRAGQPGRGVGYQNGTADRVPLCGPGEVRATDRPGSVWGHCGGAACRDQQ